MKNKTDKSEKPSRTGKETQTNRGPSQGAGGASQTVWNRLKANWYKKGLAGSGAPEAILSAVLPRSSRISSFLDVGAGCGALALPLARAGKRVTAVEPSPQMAKILKDDCEKEGLGVKCINSAWEEVSESDDVRGHDAIICANVPGLLKDNEAFLRRADALAEKAVFLITGADPHADKFYYKGLFPLIYGRDFTARGDYLKTYTMLHSAGTFANIEIVEYNFDQPFDDMEEAVEFWKEYMGLVTEEHDAKLRDFLKERLKETGEGLLAEFHKKSAVIWWNKGPS
ncbi:hypothetical protein MNBD_DELTA02-1113 [hydrothermal vent metagenome]|uniref:Methyltransferase domain-containing protein n=1 Tax=hydrothermal vent metagenome TaxID=652676 RepID=A0A3B0V6F3_9ZZZZ